jgi:hypothetical protein
LHKESFVALVLRFSFAAQVIAAFLIFILGYVGLFATLMLGLVIARGLYEAVKWLRAQRTADSSHLEASRFPMSAGRQFERRIPLSSAQLPNDAARAEIAFHPALNRRRVPEIIR